MIKIRYKRLVIYFFIILIFFLQFKIAARQGYILLPFEIIIGLLFFVWNKQNIKIWHKNSIMKIWSLFLIYSLAISIIIDFTYVSAYQGIIYKEIGMTFICFFAAQYVNHDYFLKAARNIGIVLSVIGDIEYVTKNSIFLRFITVESRQIMISQLGSSAARVRTVFIHPVICAVFTAFFWICLLYAPFKEPFKNVLSAISIIICILGTQSRSSWIALVCVTVIYLLKRLTVYRFRFKRNNIYLCGVICILSAVIIYFNWQNISSALSVFYERWMASFNISHVGNHNRLTMIKMGIRDWKDAGVVQKVFGGGASYAINYLRQHSIGGWSTAVDNQYLTILMDFGVIGEIVFLYLVCRVFILTVKSKNIMTEFYGMVLISLFISTFFYEMLSWTIVTMLFSFAICMLDKTIRFDK